MRLTLMTIIFLIISTQIKAQINGNGTIKTVIKSIKDIISINVQLNAEITLDYLEEEQIRISADENILEFIGLEFENGTLTIDQIKWIEPSTLPVITIGVPYLKSVYQGTHRKTMIKNVNGLMLSLDGNVGQIIADGNVKTLNLRTTGTDMDLSALVIDKAEVFIDDDSKVVLGKVNSLDKEISSDARLVLLSETNNLSKDLRKKQRTDMIVRKDIKWIDFNIKNNSWKRNHFVVVGPKKDGSSFSYGFSLFPNFSKSERWSTGTKVYRETASGGRELLITISSEDEGKSIDLFK